MPLTAHRLIGPSFARSTCRTTYPSRADRNLSSEPQDDAFEKLVAQLNYPMCVVTTAAGGVNAGTHLMVHLFGREHLGVAELFGGRNGDSIDKFEHCRWHLGPLPSRFSMMQLPGSLGGSWSGSLSAIMSGISWSR